MPNRKKEEYNRRKKRKLSNVDSPSPSKKIYSNSIKGATSVRALSYSKQMSARNHSARYWDPVVRSQNNNPTRSQTSVCIFKCWGQDVEVLPGDCIACPENAWCPDNENCTMNFDGAEQYLDSGWACCGCAADYENDGNPYGKKMSWNSITFTNSDQCDDGRYIDWQYGCREQWCGPTYWGAGEGLENCPSGDGLDWYNTNFGPDSGNWWQMDDNGWYSGPWNCDSDYTGGGNNCTNMFAWSDNQNQMDEDLYGGSTTGLTYQVPGCPVYSNLQFGGLLRNMACAEWGMDGGDVLIEYDCEWNDDADRWEGDACCTHPPLTHEDWVDIYDLPDPNHHNSHITTGFATCRNKCFRPQYTNPSWINPMSNELLNNGEGNKLENPSPSAIYGDDFFKWDPGGVARTAGGGQCFCDEFCYACGCNPASFAKMESGGLEAYHNCMGICSGDCAHPLHFEIWGESEPLPAGKIGTIPGYDCGNTGAPLGDCCDDWKAFCIIPPADLPCDCYLAEDSDGDGIGDTMYVQMPDFGNCSTSNDDNCGWTSTNIGYCDTDNECQIMCTSVCNNTRIGPSQDSWEELHGNLDNYFCTMENFNIDMGNPDQSNWSSNPYCYGSYKNSNCSDHSACHCDCETCDLTVSVNDYEQEPHVGCNIVEACNYVSPSISGEPEFACTKEFLESEGYGSGTCHMGNEERSGTCLGGYRNGKTCTEPADCSGHPDWDDASYCNMPSDTNLSGTSIPEDVIRYYTMIQAYKETSACDEDIYLQHGKDCIWTETTPGVWGCQDNQNTCNGAAEDLYNDWITGMENGCLGCPDPEAGNYTGDSIYRLVNNVQFPIDCSGTGASFNPGHSMSSADLTCCFYEKGCDDENAVNWLDATENSSNETRGGLATLGEWAGSTTIPMVDSIWKWPDIAGFNLAGQWEILTVGDDLPGGDYWTSDEFVYCFAPDGCRFGSSSEEYCVFNTTYYCADPDACNFSMECNLTVQLGGPGGTCTSTPCIAEVTIGAVTFDAQCVGMGDDCEYSQDFCIDPDGDGYADTQIAGDGYPKGCDLSGYVETGPNDARPPSAGYGDGGMESCGGGSEFDPRCFEIGIDEFGQFLIDCEGDYCYDNGWPLRNCNTEDDIAMCPTNQTHGSWEYEGVTYGCFVNLPPAGGTSVDTDLCCTTSGCCGDVIDGNILPDECDGDTVNDFDLPCCMRDDDCGYCYKPNQGIFVTREGQDSIGTHRVYQAGGNALPYAVVGGHGCDQSFVISDPSYLDNIPIGGVARFESSQTPSITNDVNNSNYHVNTFCSCGGESQIACNCLSQDLVNDGTVCGHEGMPDFLVEDCLGECGGDAVEDECGECNGDGLGDACDCSGVVEDCFGDCGGDGQITIFCRDDDKDGICQACNLSGTAIEVCYNPVTGVTIPDINIVNIDTEDNAGNGFWYQTEDICEASGMIDEDDTIPCETNFIDACGVCRDSETDPNWNNDQDCNGDCFGTAVIDDCDNCVLGDTDYYSQGCLVAQTPPTENQEAPGTCEYNWAQDQCGLCPGETQAEWSPVLSEPITLTWGSYGCDSEDWFALLSPYHNLSETCDPSGDGISCELNDGTYCVGTHWSPTWGYGIRRHCGCQCAGCTNMYSPSWSPYAKYSTDEGDLSHDWNQVIQYQNQSTCEIYDSWPFCHQRVEVYSWFWEKYKDFCDAGPQPGIGPDNIYCPFVQNMCIVDGEYTFGSYGVWYDGEIRCEVDGEIGIDSLLAMFQEECFYWHGKMYFEYCENETLGIESYVDNDSGETIYCADFTDAENLNDGECASKYGAYCCGLDFANNRGHCRTGVRSDLFWYVDRVDTPDPGEIEDNWEELLGTGLNPWSIISGFGSGDVVADGDINIQDVVYAISFILGNVDVPWWEQQIMDLNGDGTVDVLDIIQLINIILERENGRGTTYRRTLNTKEQASVIRALKPSFGNSTNSKYRLTDKNGFTNRQNKLRAGRSSNNRRLTESLTQTTRTQYDIQSFNFMFNATECIPSDVFVEVGPHFVSDWTWSSGEQDGFYTFGSTAGAGVITVDTQQEYHMLSIYHRNVHMQAHPQFRPIGGVDNGNRIIYDTSCDGCGDDLYETEGIHGFWMDHESNGDFDSDNCNNYGCEGSTQDLTWNASCGQVEECPACVSDGGTWGIYNYCFDSKFWWEWHLYKPEAGASGVCQ